MLLKRRSEPDRNDFQPDPVALAETLLGVHGAINEDWLIDAAMQVAERALGATRVIVYLLNAEGELVGRGAATDARRMADVAFEDAIGVGLAKKRFPLAELPAFEQAGRSQQPNLETSLAAVFPASFTPESAAEVQQSLGIRTICVTPLVASSQFLGVLVIMFPYELESADLAQRVAAHVARALLNLRELERTGESGHLDRATGTWNERSFLNELGQEVRRAQRYGRTLSLLLIRLENYRDVNSRYGQFLSNRLLRQVGGVLYDQARESDFVAAFGEHGFAVVLAETDAGGLEGAARRLTDAAAGARIEGDVEVRPELTVGWSTMPEDGTDPDTLLSVAVERLDANAAARGDDAAAAASE